MAKAKTKQRGLPPNAALDASKQKEFNQKVQAAKEKVYLHIYLFVTSFRFVSVERFLPCVLSYVFASINRNIKSLLRVSHARNIPERRSIKRNLCTCT